jgi:predicted RNA-binding protein with PIN domain
METIIIDAYNLIHKVKELHILLKQPQDVAVDTMIAKLQSHFHLSKIKIVLVFDGFGMNRHGGNINVKFSKTDSVHFMNADELIKDLIDRSRNPKLLRIVSSDNSIALYARDSGCKIQSSASFWDELREKRLKQNIAGSKEGSEKPQVVTRGELEFLLKEFNRK